MSDDIKQLAGRHAPPTILGPLSLQALRATMTRARERFIEQLAREVKERLNLKAFPVVIYRRVQLVDSVIFYFAYGIDSAYSLTEDPERCTVDAICEALRWRLGDNLERLQGEG